MLLPATVFAVLSSRSKNKRQESESGNAEVDVELGNYLAALAPESAVESTLSFGNAEVYQLRLDLISTEQLRELAMQRNTSPAALAQEWVLQRLDWEMQHQQQTY